MPQFASPKASSSAAPKQAAAPSRAPEPPAAAKLATGGNLDLSGVPLRVPPKLAIGDPDDPLEREADRMAEQVMRMPNGAGPVSMPSPSRGVFSETFAPKVVHEALASPGRPLDAATRSYFEPRFGCDFSQVRVHDGSLAAASAAAIGARAYSGGRSIVFAKGEYALSGSRGRHLIAHELAHVAQQRGEPLRVHRKAKDADKDDKDDGDKIKSGQEQFTTWTNELIGQTYTLKKQKGRKAKSPAAKPAAEGGSEAKKSEPAKEIFGEERLVYNSEKFGREARADSGALMGKLNDDVVAYLESPEGQTRLKDFTCLPQGHALRQFLIDWQERQEHEQRFVGKAGKKFGKKIFKALRDLFRPDELKKDASEGTKSAAGEGIKLLEENNPTAKENSEALDHVPDLAKRIMTDFGPSMNRVSRWMERHVATMKVFGPAVLAAPNLAGFGAMTKPGENLIDKTLNDTGDKHQSIPLTQKGLKTKLSLDTKNVSYSNMFSGKGDGKQLSTKLSGESGDNSFDIGTTWGKHVGASASLKDESGLNLSFNAAQQDDYVKSDLKFGKDWKKLGKNKKNSFGFNAGATLHDTEFDSLPFGMHYSDGNHFNFNADLSAGSGANNSIAMTANKQLGRFGLYGDLNAKTAGLKHPGFDATLGTDFNPLKSNPKYVVVGQVQARWKDGTWYLAPAAGLGHKDDGAFLILYDPEKKNIEFTFRKNLTK